MTTLVLEKKANFSRTTFSDEKDLFLYILDYMQDVKDLYDVKQEIKNDNWYRVSFDNFLKNV